MPNLLRQIHVRLNRFNTSHAKKVFNKEFYDFISMCMNWDTVCETTNDHATHDNRYNLHQHQPRFIEGNKLLGVF